jgi:hypothetical protein
MDHSQSWVHAVRAWRGVQMLSLVEATATVISQLRRTWTSTGMLACIQ